MVVISGTKQGKSVLSVSLYVNYTMRSDGEGNVTELQGIVCKDDKTSGFLSYDFIRSGLQFSLNPDNGLSVQENKELFEVFLEDIENLITA